MMITLYTYTTPNGRKISIMLEELGIEYQVKIINIGEGEQFDPAFLAVSPNNKIPAIVDDAAPGGPLSLFESGAILTYLAEQYGRFLAPQGAERFKTLQWLNWQMGGLGPMLGQLGHFGKFADEKIPYAIQRYTDEADRLLGVMEKQLSTHKFLAGDQYSIADIASYPWTLAATDFLEDILGDSLAQKPALQAWLQTVGERPAVQRGMEIPVLPQSS